MTQPPDEPDQGRQPPGPSPQPPPQPPPAQQQPYPQQPNPQQPYGQQPYGQPYAPGDPANPYGGGTMNYYQPIDSGGMSRGRQDRPGHPDRPLRRVLPWFVAAVGFAAGSDGDNGFLFYAAVAPLVVPAPLLIWRATRPWAVGLLMGTAVASIGMSSLCSAMISSSEGGA